MRLIDADALIEKIKYSFYPDERVCIDTITGCFLDEAGSPTVDAVPAKTYKKVCDELRELKYKYRNVDDDDVWKYNMKALG